VQPGAGSAIRTHQRFKADAPERWPTRFHIQMSDNRISTESIYCYF
jgi:hypothetical protein